MGFLNPHLKNVEDFRHKLWDHLFLISDFKLEVKSPYPIPTRESLKRKAQAACLTQNVIQNILTWVKILEVVIKKH